MSIKTRVSELEKNRVKFSGVSTFDYSKLTDNALNEIMEKRKLIGSGTELRLDFSNLSKATLHELEGARRIAA